MRGWLFHIGLFANIPIVVVRVVEDAEERPSSSRASRRGRMPDPYAVELELSLWHDVPQLMWSHSMAGGRGAGAVVADRQRR